MDNDTKSISFGSATVLVYDEKLRAGYESDFYKWLIENGFENRSKKGFYDSCPWIFVNMSNKAYAFGMSGMKLAEPFGGHAVTIEEFMEIY